MTDYLQLLANIGGTVGLVIAGMEAKSFLDQSRHWSHGRLELAAVRHDFIRSTTKDSKVLNQIEYDWLRLMNAGAAPIRIRHLLLHGMDIIDDLMPNELEMNMLLAPSESLVIPVMTRKDEKAWALALYLDSSDKRFMYMQYISYSFPEAENDELPWPYRTFREWIMFLWRNRVLTIHPKTSSDVHIDASIPELQRVRLGSRWTPRELESVIRAMREVKGTTYLDLTQWGLSERRASDDYDSADEVVYHRETL